MQLHTVNTTGTVIIAVFQPKMSVDGFLASLSSVKVVCQGVSGCQAKPSPIPGFYFKWSGVTDRRQLSTAKDGYIRQPIINILSCYLNTHVCTLSNIQYTSRLHSSSSQQQFTACTHAHIHTHINTHIHINKCMHTTSTNISCAVCACRVQKMEKNRSFQ